MIQKLKYMLYILEKKLGHWPFCLIFQSDSGKKYENRKFDQKSENLKPDKILIFDLMRSTPPQHLPKTPMDLKIVSICSGWSYVNLLVYG